MRKAEEIIAEQLNECLTKRDLLEGRWYGSVSVAKAVLAIEQAQREAIEEAALEAEDYESRDAYGTAAAIRKLLSPNEKG